MFPCLSHPHQALDHDHEDASTTTTTTRTTTRTLLAIVCRSTPRVPSHEDHSVVNVGNNNNHARATSSSSTSSLTQLASTKKQSVAPVDDVSKMLTPATSRHRFTTFHYELNLYCAIVLGALYYYVARHHQAARLGMHVLFALIALDAAKYYYWRGSMAGVPYTLPMVSFLAMIIGPGRFWHDMAAIAMSSRDGNDLVPSLSPGQGGDDSCHHVAVRLSNDHCQGSSSDLVDDFVCQR